MARVLLTSDGSAASTRAARDAVTLLGRDHAFHIAALVELASFPDTPDSLAPALPADWYSERNDRLADQATQDALDLAIAASVAADVHVVAGPPATAVCELAADIRADLIVVADHKRGWLGRLLWGSLAGELEQLAPCPIFVFHDHLLRPAA